MLRFKLPDIGEGVVEAEVVEWKVKVGDVVEADQTLVELMTDKASFEIPSPVAGTIARLGFREGDVVKVGEVLLEIEDGNGDAAKATAPPPPKPAAAAPPQKPAAPPPAPEPAAPKPTRPAATPPHAAEAPANHHPPRMPARPVSHQRASHGLDEDGVQAVPAVRELARRLGVELAGIAGSGPGGRIMRRDVEEAARNAPAPAATAPAPEPALQPTAPPAAPRAQDPPDWKRVPLRGVRRAIARHMLEARHRAAHFSYVEEVDLTELMNRRAALAAAGAEAPSPLAFLARAVVRTLPAHPSLNASLEDDSSELILKGTIHLGIAVATDDGLVVPVIHDASAFATQALAARIAELSERARAGTLRPEEARGGTFTITSLGKLGGIVSTPIVNYPESAILGVNAIRKRPRYQGDALVPRHVMNVSMSVDHRVADGFHCARFVEDLRGILEAADFPDLFEAGA